MFSGYKREFNQAALTDIHIEEQILTLWQHWFFIQQIVVRWLYGNPPLGLFGKKKQIPVHANARLQHWALLLSQFNFDLVFRAGKENYVADALSRLPIVDADSDSSVPVEYVNLINVIEHSDIDLDKVKLCTRQDPILKHVVNNLKFGWKNQPNVSEYFAIKKDLSLHDNLVFIQK